MPVHRSSQRGSVAIDLRAGSDTSSITGAGLVTRRMTPSAVKPTLGVNLSAPRYPPPIPSAIYIPVSTFSSESMTASIVEEEDDLSNEPDTPVNISERQRFLLFFKILVLNMSRAITDHNQKVELHRRMKAIVQECMASPSGAMTRKLERKLRKYVGEKHWQHAQGRFDAYCCSRGICLR